LNKVSQSIVLIGMMGVGKSCVGSCLRRRTGLALFDTDEMVAAKLGMSIPEIFAEHGENKFREAETQALRSVPTTEQTITVTGGGIVLREKNIEFIKKLGAIVWLDADEETLFVRALQKRNRPLLETKDPRKAFSQILGVRRPLYAQTADIRLDTWQLTPEEVAMAILSKVGRLNRKPRSSIPATTSS
jgi:shikimate kinase